MHPSVKNTIAVIMGIIVGGAVNMGVVAIGPMIVPPPVGADMNSIEGLRAAMPLLRPEHFIIPLLAHALGSFVSGYVVSMLAVNYRMVLALSLGLLTLIGGIVVAYLVPAPAWFIVLDLVFAYIPMAWLGGRLGMVKTA